MKAVCLISLRSKDQKLKNLRSVQNVVNVVKRLIMKSVRFRWLVLRRGELWRYDPGMEKILKCLGSHMARSEFYKEAAEVE